LPYSLPKKKIVFIYFISFTPEMHISFSYTMREDNSNVTLYETKKILRIKK